MAERPRIPFFTDNDVAESVGKAILAAGHDLTRLRDVMLTDSPDPVVAAACREGGLVLVTHNWRDFRRIVRDEAGSTLKQVSHLCRVELLCQQFRGAVRIAAEMSLIEREWQRYLDNPDQPLRVEIGNEFVRLNRDWLREQNLERK